MNEPDALDEHSFRSTCPVSRTLELVGDKWTLLIVRDLMWHGKSTFQALENSAENMPTNLLADRLRRLRRWGLVTREPYQDRPVRYRYALTDTGRLLEPILLEMTQWGHMVLGGDLGRDRDLGEPGRPPPAR